ncbi:mechanosensitive ion channel-like protein [Thermovibrio guaymasensis]|uniref:Mechanosensitive ion channel-like protein n=1 Tax=Thermovibrio guaymasensis TaxID=240167 RepID=A0A420W8W5_9BACT|nr:mechanosensitive ion channel domain-containing protein [Thermovibrio guaymasensis]RKQ63712.1 mechanosensitive ion channel-like protein [Thermovibrio guaymasensis]
MRLINLQPIIFFTLSVILSLLIENLLRKFAFRKIREKLLADAVVFVLFSLILFWIGWELSNLYKEWNLKETLRNLTLFVSALYLTRATNLITQQGKIGKILAYLSFTSALILSLLFIYLPVQNEKVLKLLIYGKKFFIYLGILSVTWQLSYTFKNETISRVFRYTSFSILTAIFFLWLFEYLKFNFHSLIGIALIILLTAVYTIIYSKLIPKAAEELLEEFTDKDIDVVTANSKRLVTVIYAILAIKILELSSNFSDFFSKIYGVYLIKTDLVKISIGNIVDFTVTALILFSLLGIGKKLVKLFFPKERREVEGGSAEALIFNLGVLFNSIILLSTLGITWKVILPIAGTLGVGLGFGLQTIMNNYVSGFILLFSKKLKVGDIVELPSISISTLGEVQTSVFGKVEDIGILSTIVRTNDGVEISIPNSNFINSPIVNFSLKDPFVRLKVPIGVAYSSDPLKVKEILERVIDELPYVVRFLPKNVQFEELGDSALIFKAMFWIDVRKNVWVKRVVSDFYYKVWYKLKEEGIEIPFPQNDIWFRNKLKLEIEKPSGGKN